MTAQGIAARLMACAVLGWMSPGALAAPDEIQVYTEEMDEPGTFGLELHVNYVPDGRTQPTYEGEMKSNHRLQLTPEFSYGLSRTLEAGLYLSSRLFEFWRMFDLREGLDWATKLVQNPESQNHLHARARARMVPSSCHGVVLAEGKG